MRGLLVVGLLLTGVGVAQVPVAPVVHAVYPAGAGTALGEQIAGLLADPGASRAHWGIAVTAMDGTPIYGRSEGKLFRPASNAKLFTTAAAMALLGGESQVTTRLVMAGHHGLEQTPIVDGSFDGDLLLSGGGDANFGSGRRFPYLDHLADKGQAPEKLQELHAMAASVAALGVKRVKGDIVVDDAMWPYEPVPETWGVDDLMWGYGAPVSAMTVNDNEVKLTVTPGKAAAELARAMTAPDLGYYTLDTKDLETGAAGEPESLRIELWPGSQTIRISGVLPVGAPYVTELAIDDPAKFAGMALKTLLVTQGVMVEGVVRVEHRAPVGELSFTRETRMPIPKLPVVLGEGLKEGSNAGDNIRIVSEMKSPKLSEDLAVTLKESQNLHAEMMLRRLGAKWGTSGSNAQGVRVIRQWLVNAGLDGDVFFFYDGSGLSSHDLVTPRATAQLLAYAATQPWFATWKAALPVSGVDGTLGGRFKDGALKGKVFAKTGTLGESRALSGYVECASGKTVIFSVMADDHAPSGSTDRAVMDKIVAAIAASN
jgi:D-alanyl-D-alanine carboxypeptidase/D-alanyl-D-alanine-endopeptidase (penicillin-binding protein 4)